MRVLILAICAGGIDYYAPDLSTALVEEGAWLIGLAFVLTFAQDIREIFR